MDNMILALRYYGLIFIRICLLSFLSLTIVTSASSASDNVKIYAVLRTSEIGMAENILKNPNIDGITFYTGWKKIEPKRHVFDFSTLDFLCLLVEKYNKTVNIGVLPGQWSPDWLTDVKEFKWTFADRYVDKASFNSSSPLPWDDVYLTHFETIVSELGKRYDNNKYVGYIAITGPSLSNGLETNVALDRADFSRIGYNSNRFVKAWIKSVDTFAKAFNNKKLTIALSNQIGPIRSTAEANMISEYAFNKLGKRFNPMLLALTNEKWFDENNDYVKLATQYRSKTQYGFQMLKIYGSAPSAKTDLAAAIVKAKKLGANYVEIWGKDCDKFNVMLVK